MEKADKIYEEVNIKFLVEEMEKEAEEYGQYHDEDCQVNWEGGADFGYVCECEKIRAIKTHAREWMARVNEKWVKMTGAHLQYCTREGRDFLTRGQGKIPRSAEWRKKISEGVRKAKSV